MYTLRTIHQDGTQSNVCIGETYQLIIDQISPEVFRTIGKDFGHSDEDIYAFVQYKEGGHCVQPLFKSQRAYIMMNGKTLDNLSSH